MKMAPLSYSFLVFDFSGESTAYPGDAFGAVPAGSVSQVEVGRAKSCDEVPSLGKSLPMCCASSVLQYFILFWIRSGHFHMLGVSWALVSFLYFLLVVMTSRLKLKHEASLDDEVLWWHDVWSLWQVLLRCLLPVAATNAVESCWKRPSTIVCINSDGDVLEAFHDCSSFLVFVVSDHFINDPAVTPISATGHQLVTLCGSIWAGERAQYLKLLMTSRCCCRIVHVCSLVRVHRLCDWSQD